MPRSNDHELARICLAATIADSDGVPSMEKIKYFLNRGELSVESAEDLSRASIECIGVELSDSIVICFRCTDDIRDWRINFDTNTEEEFHRGWWLAVDRIYDRVLGYILEVTQKTRKPLRITGHSLGGALSILFSFKLKQSLPHINLIDVVTFGAPKTMTAKKTYEYPSVVGQRVLRRYENVRDIVPKFPFSYSFRSPGELIVIHRDKTLHHRESRVRNLISFGFYNPFREHSMEGYLKLIKG